ncbi:hypothetical protein [Microvirga pakistanensis]|nr:hypothetical protein [Microvirga pakistanensis]
MQPRSSLVTLSFSGYDADPDRHPWEPARKPFLPLDEQGDLFLTDHPT